MNPIDKNTIKHKSRFNYKVLKILFVLIILTVVLQFFAGGLFWLISSIKTAGKMGNLKMMMGVLSFPLKIMITDIMLLCIFGYVYSILRTLEKKTPFIPQNSKRIAGIATFIFLIIVVNLISDFLRHLCTSNYTYYKNIFYCFTANMPHFVIAFSFLILSKVLKAAVEMQQEENLVV